MFMSSRNFLTQSGASFMDLLCHKVMSFCHLCFVFVFVILSCMFLATFCWERVDPLALLCVMFFLCFVTFLYGILLGQVWCLGHP